VIIRSSLLNPVDPTQVETVSVQKAGELVGVSRRTIYNWMQQGKVDYILTAGGSRRIVLETLYQNAA
jgi:excisionase family DNA binding protein